MFGCAISPAGRRYVHRIGITMLVYALFLVVSGMIFLHLHPTGPLAYALAILPALPILGEIAVFGLYLREEKDELQRAIAVEALLWSIGGTLSVTTVWGFLESFVRAPHLQAMWIFPIFCVFIGLSTPLIMARYRG